MLTDNDGDPARVLNSDELTETVQFSSGKKHYTRDAAATRRTWHLKILAEMKPLSSRFGMK
jgi:hypothetical protein